ncbi:TnsD family Tn7-like transposition protein [Paraburkholderia sp. SIMBA_055]
MAVALFPLLDGETIGSNLARYCEFIGAESTLPLRRRLFGYPCKPDTRLPSGLNYLAEQTRDYWNLEPAEIIRRNTEFYYATATVPVKQRESMFASMLEMPGTRCLRRSASGWTGERASKFRYCEDCLLEWPAMGILAHWMVDHQLPGVYVCPAHSSVMKVAKRGLAQNWTDATVAALKSSDDEAVFELASSSELAAIADMATLSAQYRQTGRSLPSMATYCELLEAAGFVWPTGGVDIRLFIASMINHFGREYCKLAGLSLKRLSIWLRTISKEGTTKQPAHPFIFVAAESFLNNLCASPGSFIPQCRKWDAPKKENSKNNISDNLYLILNKIRCKGYIHRASDTWQECIENEGGWRLVCSCGLAYTGYADLQSVEMLDAVKSYGERHRNLVSNRFADNFIVDRASRVPTVNAQLLRWARFCGFSRSNDLPAELIEGLRDRWCSVVKNARPDRRITSSYQIDSKLYRTLYRCDRDWLAEFNNRNRTRHLAAKPGDK